MTSYLSGPKGLSRLKGIETDTLIRSVFEHNSPKGLSRLKGIETNTTLPFEFTVTVSERTFPFEGNWNNSPSNSMFSADAVRKDFPVWRELKRIFLVPFELSYLPRPKGLSRLKGIETDRHSNYEREQLCPKGLSRLKGIETLPLVE